MTNKPMLSVEQRELLGKAASLLEIHGDRPSLETCVADDLRALLDKPVVESEVDRLERRCKNAELALKVQTENCEALKAAQHQGEPVAVVVSSSWDSKRGSSCDIQAIPPTTLECGTKLYASQPAPVSVVMPEHTMRSVMDAIQQARGFPVLTSNQCHALAESLNYVARLNGVKP